MKKLKTPKHIYILCRGCAKRVRIDKAVNMEYCQKCAQELGIKERGGRTYGKAN